MGDWKLTIAGSFHVHVDVCGVDRSTLGVESFVELACEHTSTSDHSIYGCSTSLISLTRGKTSILSGVISVNSHGIRSQWNCRITISVDCEAGAKVARVAKVVLSVPGCDGSKKC